MAEQSREDRRPVPSEILRLVARGLARVDPSTLAALAARAAQAVIQEPRPIQEASHAGQC